MTIYSASEHARLLMAEASRTFADLDNREAAEEFHEAVLEAVESGHVHDIISMLACSAAEAWIRYAVEIGTTGPEVLRQVFANWADEERKVVADIEALRRMAADSDPSLS